MVEVKAGVHIEGNQAASEPTAHAQEKEAHEPGKSSARLIHKGGNIAVAHPAVLFVRHRQESRLHHSTTRNSLVALGKGRRLFNNYDGCLLHGN